MPDTNEIYQKAIADAKLALADGQADADFGWIQSVAQGQQTFFAQDALDWQATVTQAAQADNQFAHQNNATAQAEADAIVLAAADTMVPRAKAQQAQTTADATAAGNFKITQANETSLIWNSIAAQLATPWAQSQAGLASAEAAWAPSAAANYEKYASDLGDNLVQYATSDSDQFVSEMTTIDAVDRADSDKLADAQQALTLALAGDEAAFEGTAAQTGAGYQTGIEQAEHDYRYAMAQANHDLATGGTVADYSDAAALAADNRTAAQAAALKSFEAGMDPAITLQATGDADARFGQVTTSADAVLDDSLEGDQAVHDYAFAEAADENIKQKADAQALYDYQVSDAIGHAAAIVAFAQANPSPWADLAAAQSTLQAKQQIADAAAQLGASNSAADAQEAADEAEADAQKAGDDSNAQALHDQAVTDAQAEHNLELAQADVTDAVFALLPTVLTPPDDGTVVTLTPDFILGYEANDFYLGPVYAVFDQAMAEFAQGQEQFLGIPVFHFQWGVYEANYDWMGYGNGVMPWGLVGEIGDPKTWVPDEHGGVTDTDTSQTSTPMEVPQEQIVQPDLVRGGMPISTVYQIASHTMQAAAVALLFAAEGSDASSETWGQFLWRIAFGKNHSQPNEGPSSGGGKSGADSAYQGPQGMDPSNQELTKINYRGRMRAGDSLVIGNQDIKNSIKFGNFQVAIYEGIADALEDQIWNLATAGILGEAEAKLVEVAAAKTWRFGKDIIQITIGKVVRTVTPDQVEKIKKILRTAGLDDKIENVVDAIKGFSRKELRHAVDEAVEKMCFAPDTLIATEGGPKPLRDVQIGERVYAFDFELGEWLLSDVLKRHDNEYSGWIYTITAGDSRIEVTTNHPFWVVEGDNLAARTVPRDLEPGENEGQSLSGRWVNSQDLRPRDILIGRGGDLIRVEAVESRFERSFAVCNLTVRRQHTFAVGESGILAHNDTPWCKTLEGFLQRPQKLVDKAAALGIDASRVHAHHIVMRNPQAYFDQKTIDALNDSKRILRDAGIELFDGNTPQAVQQGISAAKDFANRANAGNIQNFAWAINGYEGIHQADYVWAVYEKLRAVDQKGKAAIEKVLSDIRDQLQAGEVFWKR